MIDGDTVVLDVDLGFNVSVRASFRIAGIDAPEMTKEERPAGELARTALVEILARATDGWISVESLGRDKYGRWVANLAVGADDVARLMVESGHAVAVG